jgi:hypothetical protein
MNKHHDIGKIEFHGDLFEITIDGATKRFQLKKYLLCWKKLLK